MAELRYVPGAGTGLLIAASSSFVLVVGETDQAHAERIWSALVERRPIADVLDAVTRGRFGNLPTFLVALPDRSATGLRVIQRPGIEFATTDADGGRAVRSAEGAELWSEHVLPVATSVEINLIPGSAVGTAYRLVSGIAPVSAVLWGPDSSAVPDDDIAATASAAAEGGPTHTAELDPGAGQESHGPNDVAAREAATSSEQYTITAVELTRSEASSNDLAAAGGGTEALAGAAGEAPSAVYSDDPYDSLFGTTVFRSVEGAAIRHDAESAAGLVAQPQPPAIGTEIVLTPEDGSARPDGVTELPPPPPSHAVTTGMIDSVPSAGPSIAARSSGEVPGDHDGYTVTAASLRQLRQGAVPDVLGEPRPTAGPVVHAITCPSGHPNPPQSGVCRVCGKPLSFQEPLTVPRPTLGVLVFAGGREVLLDRFVVIGRSPAVERVAPEDLPHLVKLDSPSKDLSRNHLEVRLEGWHVLLVDLQSTNGTVVQLPGRAPERVHPLEPYAIVPGTVVTLGDEHSFVYEVRG